MTCTCGTRLVYDRLERGEEQHRIILACPACNSEVSRTHDEPEYGAACRKFFGQIQEDLKKEASHVAF